MEEIDRAHAALFCAHQETAVCGIEGAAEALARLARLWDESGDLAPRTWLTEGRCHTCVALIDEDLPCFLAAGIAFGRAYKEPIILQRQADAVGVVG